MDGQKPGRTLLLAALPPGETGNSESKLGCSPKPPPLSTTRASFVPQALSWGALLTRTGVTGVSMFGDLSSADS